MNLSAVFTRIVHKQLVAVDLPDKGSNQHELNGTAAFKELFGTSESTKGTIKWHYFADDQDPQHDDGEFTFYDARAKSANRTGRTEWRFYYYGDFLSHAEVGDWFVLARTPSGDHFGLIFQRDGAWLRAARALLGVEELSDSFQSISRQALDSQKLELLQRQILNELDIEVTVPTVPTDEDLMLKKFGRTFPTTKEMSVLAREHCEVDIRRTDETLVRWLEREEQLFRALENVIIRERLVKNFATVDEFISYSLSVQNRRKSRMGFALQNHLAELFRQKGLRYTAQARTEGNNKPDFIFPGESEYHDPTFNTRFLLMLGVKSTSKDRWRQVLAEADRIPYKHLCTLEAGISQKQTNEMQRQNLSLVVPETLLSTYTPDQVKVLLTVDAFVHLVRSKQTPS